MPTKADLQRRVSELEVELASLKMPQKCWVCEADAEYLCDFPLSEDASCDHQMCKNHKTFKGHIFACGDMLGIDSNDCCSQCLTVERQQSPRIKEEYRTKRLAQRLQDSA